MKKNNLLEIRLHGRGGQGVVLAAEILALAAFYESKEAQAFPSFGVERRGAPVMSFVRIADAPIRLREQIYQPDYIVVLDATLLQTDSGWQAGLKTAQGLLVNSAVEVGGAVKHKNIATVPATDIALEIIGKPFVNMAMLGALAAFSGCVSRESLTRAMRERLPEKIAAVNVKSMEQGFQAVKMKK